MVVTEAEAKNQWCPMVRYSPTATGNYSENTTHTEGCIGSGCMMWSWRQVNTLPDYIVCEDKNATEEPKRTIDVPQSWTFVPSSSSENAHWAEPQEECNARRTGTCGLAQHSR